MKDYWKDMLLLIAIVFFAAMVGTMVATKAFAVEAIYVTPKCGVYHLDRDAVQTKNLNEKPDCLRLDIEMFKYRYEPDSSINAGINYSQFDNSMYQDTKVFGGYIEHESYDKLFDFDAGAGGGVTAGYVAGGYDTNVLAIPYMFGRLGAVRLDVGYAPGFIRGVDSSLQYGIKLDVLRLLK